MLMTWRPPQSPVRVNAACAIDERVIAAQTGEATSFASKDTTGRQSLPTLLPETSVIADKRQRRDANNLSPEAKSIDAKARVIVSLPCTRANLCLASTRCANPILTPTTSKPKPNPKASPQTLNTSSSEARVDEQDTPSSVWTNQLETSRVNHAPTSEQSICHLLLNPFTPDGIQLREKIFKGNPRDRLDVQVRDKAHVHTHVQFHANNHVYPDAHRAARSTTELFKSAWGFESRKEVSRRLPIEELHTSAAHHHSTSNIPHPSNKPISPSQLHTPLHSHQESYSESLPQSQSESNTLPSTVTLTITPEVNAILKTLTSHPQHRSPSTSLSAVVESRSYNTSRRQTLHQSSINHQETHSPLYARQVKQVFSQKDPQGLSTYSQSQSPIFIPFLQTVSQHQISQTTDKTKRLAHLIRSGLLRARGGSQDQSGQQQQQQQQRGEACKQAVQDSHHDTLSLSAASSSITKHQPASKRPKHDKPIVHLQPSTKMPTEDSQQAIAETPSESAYQPPVIKQYILANRYEIYREVGDGSFGTVSLARRRESRASSGSGNSRNPQLVAVKSMKKPITPMTECLKLRELQSLTALPPHPAIVTLNEFFYDAETKLFHMVMEFLDQNLYQLMKSREGKPFDLLTVKQILLAILEALDHCHSHNYFHRDVKPENILISYRSATDLSNASTSSQCLGTPTASKSYLGTPPTTPARMIVKLADFGLARQIDSRPPYTSYVSTRWYRAPEVLLRAEKYSAPVDMWALGSMAVEVATLKPLFPGKDEMDQVWKICEVLGSPGDWRDRQGRPTGGGPWDDGPLLAHKLGLTFPKTPPQPTTRLLNASWPDNFVEFCLSCMTWDPNVRLTSASAIRLPMFADVIRPQSNVISTPTTSSGKADTSQLSKSTQRHSWLSKTRNVVMATTLQKQARQPHASQSITVPATVNTNDPSDSPSQNTRSRKKEQRASLVLPDHERHSQAAKTKEPTTYASAAAASSTTGTTGEDLVVPTPRKLRKTSKHTGPGPDDVDAISPGSLASSSHATNPSLTSLDEAMHLLDVPAIPITISTDPMDVVLGGTCGGGGGGGSIGVPSIHTSTSTPTRDAKPLRNPTATVTTPRGPIPLPGYARSTIASSRRASSNISPDLETIQSPQQQQQPLPQHHQPTPAKKQGRLSALFGSSFTR